jgi:hypothetical protein
MKSWYNICTLLACTSIQNCSTILENNIQCDLPTLEPSPTPSFYPTLSPTPLPVPIPSSVPTYEPSFYPTFSPTSLPISIPSSVPTYEPSFYLTISNSEQNTRQIIIISSISIIGIISICLGSIFLYNKYYSDI